MCVGLDFGLPSAFAFVCVILFDICLYCLCLIILLYYVVFAVRMFAFVLVLVAWYLLCFDVVGVVRLGCSLAFHGFVGL